jgi:hypothetical protein
MENRPGRQDRPAFFLSFGCSGISAKNPAFESVNYFLKMGLRPTSFRLISVTPKCDYSHRFLIAGRQIIPAVGGSVRQSGRLTRRTRCAVDHETAIHLISPRHL